MLPFIKVKINNKKPPFGGFFIIIVFYFDSLRSLSTALTLRPLVGRSPFRPHFIWASSSVTARSFKTLGFE